MDDTGGAAAPFALNLLPGRHSFFITGGSSQYFVLADDGTLSLENPQDGSVSGNTLTITARP